MTATCPGRRSAWADSVADNRRISSSDRKRSRPFRRYRLMPRQGLDPSGRRPIASASPHDDGKHRHGAIRRNRRGVQRGEPSSGRRPCRCPRSGARQSAAGADCAGNIGSRRGSPTSRPARDAGTLSRRRPRRVLRPFRRTHPRPAGSRRASRWLETVPRGHPSSRRRRRSSRRALPRCWQWDEEAFAARGQHSDAEAPEFAVAENVSRLAGLERPDTGLGERGPGHVHSPGYGCSRGTDSCRIRSPAPKCGRKNDPISDS